MAKEVKYETFDDKFNAWLKNYRKRYKTIKPTLKDAFKDGYLLCVKEHDLMPKYKEEDVEKILTEILKD